MKSGIISGITWALNTLILGYAFTMTPFLDGKAFIFAPLISTFLHDFISALIMGVVNRKQKLFSLDALKLVQKKEGRIIAIAALVGGPFGMTCYLMSIKYLGGVNAAAISSVFPAFGLVLSFVLFKNRMRISQVIALLIAVTAIVLLNDVTSLSSGINPLGFLYAIGCIIGWGSEAIIVEYGLKSRSITDFEALQIRQSVSALTYGILILPILGIWGETVMIMSSSTVLVIAGAALFGTVSYMMYYVSIAQIGGAKAMGLNVTYVVWTLIFSSIIALQAPSVKTCLLSVVVFVFSILAAVDYRTLIGSKEV